ncbi:flagellar brake protein [Clostridium paridis]|uniref:Flagellar brake domain-containing protein n=1 Tax=Clostridium paridis TaxID=2803863 RepID=A0A937FJV8_9CLOT|nr:flagellar brake domain-containing protein [Clostridium paridis]MBL4932946.1 flagellar brake domain-containing protein [Clostridium paridis]
MKSLRIGLNRVVSIFWKDEKVYKASVQDEEEGFFYINLPVCDGEYLFFVEGQKLSMLFNDENNIYKFETTVIKRTLVNQMPLYKLEIPENYEKVQRRDYVRIEFVQKLQYVRLSDKNEELDNEYKAALLLDISGGGLRMKSKEKNSINDKVLINISFENEIVGIIGRIVRISKSEDKEFIYGIKFDENQRSSREKIVRIVFKLMRKQRGLV